MVLDGVNWNSFGAGYVEGAFENAVMKLLITQNAGNLSTFASSSVSRNNPHHAVKQQ